MKSSSRIRCAEPLDQHLSLLAYGAARSFVKQSNFAAWVGMDLDELELCSVMPSGVSGHFACFGLEATFLQAA